jgi:hypothetical protein
MTDLINTLLPFIPEKYRTLVAAIIAASPLVTRALYALINGRGIKGLFAAIWLGTNTPGPSAGNSASGSKTILILALLIPALMFTGCATAYKAEATADISVNAAMTAWNDYVAQNHPPLSQELQVKAAFYKVQAAELSALDSTILAASVTSTNGVTLANPDYTAATNALFDLVNLLRSFGVKI